MRKKTRILSLLLAVSLILSSFNMTAFAAEVEPVAVVKNDDVTVEDEKQPGDECAPNDVTDEVTNDSSEETLEPA